MARLFSKTQSANPPSERDLLNNKYQSARSVFLLVVALTVVNMVMAVVGEDTYFLFSIFIPYFLTFLGAMLCGKMPEEYYVGENAIEPYESSGIMWVLVAISAIIVIAAAVLWLISKKPSTIKMIVMLAFFALDTVLMLLISGIDLTMILDYVMHAYIIYALITGISAAAKLKALPQESPVAPDDSFIAP
ncbi:MAG: hypothetical protein IJY69_05110 [Clostridia bacterium]|nr:hypothetical protein [Clostridia bacterium]